MAGLVHRVFGGEIPRLQAHLLPEGGAQMARNLRLGSGGLEFWKRPKLVNRPERDGLIRSIYRMYDGATDYWLTWNDVVDAVRGAVAGDTEFRLYYTGDSTDGGRPKKTNLTLATAGGTDYPHDYLEMGVPAPDVSGAGTAINVSGGSSSDVTRGYVLTYVTAWGEEGPPSTVILKTGKEDGSWDFTDIPDEPNSGNYDFAAGKVRIYRTATGSSGVTQYLLVDEVSIGMTTYSDTKADAALGVVCPTFINGVVGSEWVGPPDDMHSLIALPNGLMAGISGNQVCFCEPYHFHAWPMRYRYAMNHEGVALVRIGGNQLLAATKGWPVVFTGNTPAAMTQTDIEEAHPCTSARSGVRLPGGGAFATREGMKIVGAGGVASVTDALMDGLEWREMCYPDTLICTNYQNMLMGFFSKGEEGGGNFTLDREGGRLNLSFGDYNVSAAWTDPESGLLYIVQASEIYEWDADETNNSPGAWRGARVVFPKPVNLGAFEMDADYPALTELDDEIAQREADIAYNETLLALDDLSGITAWQATTAYSDGDIAKSTDGTYVMICTAGGTSDSAEPTYPSDIGDSFSDDSVTWELIWSQQDAIRGCLRSHMLRGYVPYSSGDPQQDGQGPNADGIMLRGSLLVGDIYAYYETRSLMVRFYGDGELVHEQYVTEGGVHRLPRTNRHRVYEVEISGNIDVRWIKAAETGRELAQL